MCARCPLRELAGNCFALILLSLLVVSAQAQIASTNKPSANVSNPSAPAIVSNVDEVSLDMVVDRGRHKPVVDLKPEDIVVTDDGSAVTLSDLHLVTGKAAGNHLITLLFDQLDPSGATNAQEVAKKILKVIPTDGFSFSVFNIDGQLHMVQGFTTDRRMIEKAIGVATSDDVAERRQIITGAEKTLIASLQSGITQPQQLDRITVQAELASLTESQRIIEDQQTIPALAGLLALAREQTRIPGRKLVIYFSAGVKTDADVQDMLRSIAGTANRADVSIYVINKTAVDTKVMQGLMATASMGGVTAYNRANPLPTGQAAQQPSAFGGGMIPMVTDQISRVSGEGLAGKNDPMASMAASTGGAYLFSQDNVKKPFRQAVTDLSTYYEASYVPPKREYDGKFHPVTVKAVRRGVKVRTRAGYFAVPPAAGMRPYELPLIKLLSQPQLPTDVKFRADILHLGQLATGNENTLVVEVPISGLETRRDPNMNLLSWHVLMVSEIKDKSGAVVEHFSEDIPGHAALDSKDRGQSACATMQRHFALPPGQYTLETAVVDRNSDKMGGERSEFAVASSGSGPYLSDVALVRRIDPFPDELDPFEPLRYQHGRVVPNISDSVTSDAKDVSFFFLVHSESSPGSNSSDPAMLNMEILRNGELLGQVPLQLPKNIDGVFPYVAALRTSALPAGEYDARLELTQDGKVAEREVSFRIGGPELANASLGKPEAAEEGKGSLTMASSDSAAGIARVKREPLVITALPADSVARPSEEEIDRLIAGARKNALNYAARLPNFLCVEITDRSVDPSGKGRWRRKDSFAELLRFVQNHETRQTLEVDGHPSKEKRSDMNGPLSLGEFGHLLGSVFTPSSKAEFHWKETAALAHGTVQVFEYKVDPKNNSMLLSTSNGQVYAGFHGLAYIDTATMGIRRITMDADDLPPDFSFQAASVAIDYDYVSVGEHDYLMPMRGSIRIRRGKHATDLNQVVFQDYRRYAAQTKIVAAP